LRKKGERTLSKGTGRWGEHQRCRLRFEPTDQLVEVGLARPDFPDEGGKIGGLPCACATAIESVWTSRPT
jgi:hypothetical protein